MRPTPFCWSEAFPAHIDNHDNRQTMMSIKHGCMCSILTASLQMPFTKDVMRNVVFLVSGHNFIRRMLSMMQNRQHFLYVAVCCLDALLQPTNTKLFNICQ